MSRNAVLAAAFLVLIGCRGEKQEPGFLENAQADPSATAMHPASPGGTAVVPDVAAGTTVLVALEDGRIAIQDADRIPPGPVVFTATNTGTMSHNLFVEGPGVNKAAGDGIAVGQVTNIDAQLAPGTYTLYCPVLDHRTKGESVSLIVRPASAPPPTSTAVPAGTTTTAPATSS